MSDKPGILRNLRVKRVSLVDIGANFDAKTGDGAHIMLFKSATRKDGPSLGSVHADSPEWDADDADEYEKADLTGPARRGLPDSAFAAVWTDASGKKHRKLPIHDAGHLAAARGRIDGADIPADVKAAARRKIESAPNHKEKNVKKSILQKMLAMFGETDVEKRKAAATEIEKDIDNLEKAHDPDDAECKCADCMSKQKRFTGDPADLIAKAVTEVEKKHALELKKANDRTEEIAKALEVEKQARLTGEMLTVCKSFRAVPINTDLADPKNDVVKFMKMKASDPEMYDRTIALLKASDEQLASSALYRDLGTGQAGGSGDAWSQIEAKADALVEKSTNGLTREQAIEKVCLDPKNKELVKQYRGAQ